MIRKLIPILLILNWACKAPEAQDTTQIAQKIITAGGTVTEVVYELGFGNQIVATDITSTYPASMQSLPSIGYRNQIKAEGILALAPDLIIAEEDYLSEDVINQLTTAQIEVHLFKKPENVEETKILISEMADFFQVEDKGKALLTALEFDLENLNTYLSTSSSTPKATFIMARGPQTVFMAGEETFAQSIFLMAGLQPTSEGFKDFVPVTPEALANMNPDYLVFFDSGIQSLGGFTGVAQIKGLSETTAVKNGKIISMDGHFLSGFGPRVGKAALELAKAARP